MAASPLQITPIGKVRRISDTESVIEILPEYGKGLLGIGAGDLLDVLYWMHNLHPDQRNVLQAHPRGDKSRALKGVFGLRSPMRPNPVGVSTVRVTRVEHARLFVQDLDAEDASPVLDVKAAAPRAVDRFEGRKPSSMF